MSRATLYRYLAHGAAWPPVGAGYVDSPPAGALTTRVVTYCRAEALHDFNIRLLLTCDPNSGE